MRLDKHHTAEAEAHHLVLSFITWLPFIYLFICCEFVRPSVRPSVSFPLSLSPSLSILLFLLFVRLSLPCFVVRRRPMMVWSMQTFNGGVDAEKRKLFYTFVYWTNKMWHSIKFIASTTPAKHRTTIIIDIIFYLTWRDISGAHCFFLLSIYRIVDVRFSWAFQSCSWH